MPPRITGQPDGFIKLYRQRLNEEMKHNGETDRSLADKLAARGFSVPFSSINKTRNGTRQPTLDECYLVASILGYESLDAFLQGRAHHKLERAAKWLKVSAAQKEWELQVTIRQGLSDLAAALRDPDVIASGEQEGPDWLDHYYQSANYDLQELFEDQHVFGTSMLGRLQEVFAQAGGDDAQA